MKSLKLTSYAKLNLYLKVLKKLPDGYHSIFTLFERVSLSDEIKLRLLPEKEIRILISKPRPGLAGGRNNLAYKAAGLLKSEFRIRQGVEISIKKNIPVAAGLGGGSSNAATVLMGLNRLWKLNLKTERLLRIARKIGSDVAFFLYNCSFASATSRGDRVKVLRLPLKMWHIIIVPPVKVLSPLIYKAWDQGSGNRKPQSQLNPPFGNSRMAGRQERAGLTPLIEQSNIGAGKERAGLTTRKTLVKIIKTALCGKDFLQLNRALQNSLEPVARGIYPQIKKARKLLSDSGVKVIMMSGSGPAVFGLVSSRKEAYTVVKQLNKLVSWDVFVARTV